MALYRVRAQVSPGHDGYRRAGRFWSSAEWTEVDLTPAEVAILEADKRIMIELGGTPKNVQAAKSEAIAISKELESAKRAHVEMSEHIAKLEAHLRDANAEIDRLQAKLETSERERTEAIAKLKG